MIVYIDTENVSSDWTDSFPLLKKEDFVYIFYTKNSKPLELSRLDEFRNASATIHLIETPVGDNALDFSLASFLGNKIGKSKQHVILSADKGYVPLIDFWREESELLVFPDTKHFVYYLKKGTLLNDEFIEIASINQLLGISEKDGCRIKKALAGTKKLDLSGIHEKLVREFGSETGANYYKDIKKLLKKERTENNGIFIGS